MHEYHIEGPDEESLLIRAWSQKRLSFEPAAWELEFRNGLRAAIKRLTYVNDHCLKACYSSSIQQFCDVENILFYNVGSSCFKHLSHSGMIFERVFFKPPGSLQENVADFDHYYSYSLKEGKGKYSYWEPSGLLSRWDYVPCRILYSIPQVARVWYWTKNAMNSHKFKKFAKPENNPKKLGLMLTIHVPENAKVNLPSLMKPLFDGVLSAFYKHIGTHQALILEYLSSVLGEDHQIIADFLSDDKSALLGSRRLLWPHGKGVQWNPGDDYLVAGCLSINRLPGLEWYISGELVELQPTDLTP